MVKPASLPAHGLVGSTVTVTARFAAVHSGKAGGLASTTMRRARQLLDRSCDPAVGYVPKPVCFAGSHAAAKLAAGNVRRERRARPLHPRR